VDWKPERTVQAKIRGTKIYSRWTESLKGRSRQNQGFSKQNRKSYDCWNTLREEYTASVQEWRLFQDFKSRVDFLPVKASITTLHWAYYIRWLDHALKNAISNEDCRVLCCETTPLSKITCFVSFHRVTYPVRLYNRSSRIHTFIHSCIHINTFMYSHVHACTCICTTSIYTWLHQSPRVCSGIIPSARSSTISSNKFKQTNSLKTFQKCHPQWVWLRGVTSQSCFKWQVQTNEQLEPLSKCHPQWTWSRDFTNQSCLKWQVPTNEQLEPFQKCHPQWAWSRDVTNQSFQVTSSNKRTTWALLKVSSPVSLVERCHQSIMFQVASSNKRTTWNFSPMSSPVWLVQRCHQSNGKVPVPTNGQLVSTPFQKTSSNEWTYKF